MQIFGWINAFFADPNKSIIWDDPFYIRFLSTCIITPITETIIFQFILKLILDFIRIKNYYLVLAIMTVPFSALHSAHMSQNNIAFSVLFTLGIGVLVNYYLQVQKREGTKQAVIKTAILHSTFNLTIVILNYI